MLASQIASNLALINWTVLAGLGVGSFGVVLVGRLRTSATKGYLAFTAFCAAGLGALAWLSDDGLSPAASGSPVVADPAFDAPRRVAMALFVVLALVTTVAMARGRRGVWPGTAALLAGVGAIILGALAWGTGGAVFINASRTLVQEAAPAALRGRVLAVYQLGFVGSGPLGFWLSGVLCDAFGPLAALRVCAAGMGCVIAGVAALSSARRL